MREILFIGKNGNEEWVQGDLVQNGYDYDFAIFEKENKLVTAVIDETVGQFTGLTDKNGKKIFEGDIIKIYLYEPKGLANYEVGCIKYDNTKARFVFCTKEGNYSIDNSNAFEVIGNIHDNPELLGGGSDA